MFPDRINNLPAFEGPFDAFKLTAEDCDVLFASYPAGTEIAAHSHETENVGVVTQGELHLTANGTTTIYGVGQWYHIAAGTEHSARFDVDSAEIEFWFTSS